MKATSVRSATPMYVMTALSPGLLPELTYYYYCSSQVINTTFLPCKHQSCKRCIQRHMLQSDTCFFCKAVISCLEPKVSP